MTDLTAATFSSALLAMAKEEQRVKYQRFFPGDDSFVGVRMGDVFEFAKQSFDMPVSELETVLESRSTRSVPVQKGAG